MPHEFLPREMGDVDVPEISDADLAERMARFRLVVARDGHTHVAEMPEPRGMSFLWDPKLLHPVGFVPLAACWFDVTCGYHGLFKPTIAEVLAQIPERLHADANAFCIDPHHPVGIYRSGAGQRAVVQFGWAGEPLAKTGPASVLQIFEGEITRRDKPFKDPHRILSEIEASRTPS